MKHLKSGGLPGDLERELWKLGEGAVSKELLGRVFSNLSELGKSLQPIEGWDRLSEIRIISGKDRCVGYTLYGRIEVATGFTYPIAYNCNGCKSIRVEEFSIIDEVPTNAENKNRGYYLQCKECSEYLEHVALS